MDFILSLISELSQLSRGHLGNIALAFVATVLVIFGGRINSFIKRHTASLHFLLRTLCFMLLCAFGYGAAIIFISPKLASLLSQLDNHSLSPMLLVMFLGLGLLVEKSRS